MNSYLSTFPAGLMEPVKAAIKQELSNSTIKLLLDGAVIYSTPFDAARIQNLDFVSNSFAVIREFPIDSTDQSTALLDRIIKDPSLDRKLRGLVERKERKFRIVVSKENTLTRAQQGPLRTLEKRIASITHLALDRAFPDVEFWCYLRREGHGYFAKRLTKRKATEKNLNRGELRPELANILCRLSEPCSEDIFLDPFCGYGAIPLQRALFPHQIIFASDKEELLIRAFKQRICGLRPREQHRLGKVIIRRDDALHLARFQNGFIHKIVTDPPWGHFSSLETDLQTFYRQMVLEMARVLKIGGIAVILSAEKEILASTIEPFRDSLHLSKQYNILVSGKKATVFKLTRHA